MKFKWKNKKEAIDVELGVEKIVEEKMKLDNEDWKEKFTTKHNAKKEIMQLKHKIEVEKLYYKKNWFERMQEEKRKLRELEIQEEIRKEKERNKKIKFKIGMSIVLGIIGVILFILADVCSNVFLGSFEGFRIAGLLIIMTIPCIWFLENLETNKSKK